MDDDEIVTKCDQCNDFIRYNRNAIMRFTGEIIDGMNVVSIICLDCADRKYVDG